MRDCECVCILGTNCVASGKFQGSVKIRVRPPFCVMKNKGKQVTVGSDSFNDGNETAREACTEIEGLLPQMKRGGKKLKNVDAIDKRLVLTHIQRCYRSNWWMDEVN